MSEVMSCLPQKSSISCVSRMPPMSEPAICGRLKMRLLTFGEGCGCSGEEGEEEGGAQIALMQHQGVAR